MAVDEAKDNEIAVLTTEENLRHLSNSAHIFVDGTFKMCPKHFVQIYIFHAFVNNQYVACVFCLLPNKKEKTYKAMIDLILELAASNSIAITPTVIHADLEIAPMNAFQI